MVTLARGSVTHGLNHYQSGDADKLRSELEAALKREKKSESKLVRFQLEAVEATQLVF